MLFIASQNCGFDEMYEWADLFDLPEWVQDDLGYWDFVNLMWNT